MGSKPILWFGSCERGRIMAGYIALTVIIGAIIGHFIIPAGIRPGIENIVTFALAFMVFTVGIDIGANRSAWQRIGQLGYKILLVPICVVVGSLLGAGAATIVLKMPLREVLAVGAGLGWYSLSGVLIAKIYSVELGAIAFLANVFREILAFVIIPVVVTYCGKIAAIAPGGATTMDSTLPLITKLTDSHTAVIAFLNGLILSFIVPVLIPLFLS